MLVSTSPGVRRLGGECDTQVAAANKIYIEGDTDNQIFTVTCGRRVVRGEVATLDAVDMSSATNAQRAVGELDT